MNRKLQVLSSLAALAFTLFFAAGAEAQQLLRLSMGTGGTGGVFYIMGGGIANILTKYMPNTEVTVEETGGSVDNCKLLKSGKADLGLSGADICIDAFQGVGKFGKGNPEEKIAIRSLGAIYTNHMHFISHKDGPIRTVFDVKGKRVKLVREQQMAALPITVVRGKVVKAGAYPTLEEVKVHLNGANQ